MTLQNSEILTEDPLNSISQPPLAVPPQEITKDLFLYRAFVNTYALKTDVGLLIVDPGSLFAGEATYEAIRKWTKDKLHTAVYTHGHIDHAFGLRRFIEAGERPNIIAQENCLKRFQRYRLTRGLNTAINRVQFSRPQFEEGDTAMASHIAEWATRANPIDREAQELKRDVYPKRIEETESIMAQGIFRAAMNEAKGILGEKLQ